MGTQQAVLKRGDVRQARVAATARVGYRIQAAPGKTCGRLLWGRHALLDDFERQQSSGQEGRVKLLRDILGVHDAAGNRRAAHVRISLWVLKRELKCVDQLVNRL